MREKSSVIGESVRFLMKRGSDLNAGLQKGLAAKNKGEANKK